MSDATKPTPDPTKKRLKGAEAIDYAASRGLWLSKYADPTEGARDGLTISEARAVAEVDPGLIFLDVKSGPDPRCVVGAVYQFRIDHENVTFRGCLLIVTEPKAWGFQGYVGIPATDGPNLAFLRCKWADVEYVGLATWVRE